MVASQSKRWCNTCAAACRTCASSLAALTGLSSSELLTADTQYTFDAIRNYTYLRGRDVFEEFCVRQQRHAGRRQNWQRGLDILF